MAGIKVKLFGRHRLDAGWSEKILWAEDLREVFAIVSGYGVTPALTLVYLNGVKCHRKRTKLQEGDEVWLMTAASGG